MKFEVVRTTLSQRQKILQGSATSLRRHQLTRLNRLLKSVLANNPFYQNKFLGQPPALTGLEQLTRLPLTSKKELVNDTGDACFARNLTFAPNQYTRFHRTSGTRGRPMIVLDSPEDWRWWMEAWQYVLDSANLSATDRVAMAFSFGPFIGFWSAFDAVVDRGAMAVPTGAMSTLARLDLIQSIAANVVFCTPSYAIHLSQIAAENQIDLRTSPVDRIVVAGEPGGSVPAIRDKIQSAWSANVVDHCGASEVGPWGIATPDGQGIFVNEAEFVPEFIPAGADNAVLQPKVDATDNGGTQVYELVLTCLGRIGSPVIRYRTGDLVRPVWDHGHDCRFVKLDGGVLGRADDMMIIRGVNVFPSSIDQIIRSFPEVVEYRFTAFKSGAMDQLRIEVETGRQAKPRIQQAFETRLGFRVDVEFVEAGSLPRFEAKAKRFVDRR